MAVAELPSGGPSDHGLPVDDSIPGYKTYNKPEEDVRKPEHRDEPIKRLESPNDYSKDRDRIDTREDNKDIGPPSYTDTAPEDSSPKTPYPYRDDKPNTHNASVAEIVVGLHLLDHAPILFLRSGSKVAADIEDIEQQLSPKVQTRSKKCVAQLRRADVNNLRWIFAVNCGNGPKVVRLKANRSGNVVKFSKLGLQLACSCPAWRWQGPEYHAQQHDYQDPKTPLQGNASAPNIRDPQRVNKVCKHVAAVLSMTRDWEIPARGK